MEKIFKQTLLYDFYGELLTEHQRNIYEDAVYNDMSLSEIAQEYGISRQGVHDLIKRCDKILQGYESKLHLVAKFTRAKETVREIMELTQLKDVTESEGMQSEDTQTLDMQSDSMQSRMEQIRQLSEDLMKEL